MTASEAADRVLDPGVMSMLVLGAGLVSAFLDLPYTGMIFVIGFAVLVPLTAMLGGSAAGDDTGTRDDTDAESALETLRERYARGEIDEAEYERRLEDPLATESVGEAKEYVERRTGPGDWGDPTTDDRELEREPR